MTKPFDEKERILLLGAALLGGTWAGGVTLLAPAIYDQAKKEAILSAPAEVLTGNADVPEVDLNQLAEILAKDSDARIRWDEMKAMMGDVERLASERTKLAAEEIRTWSEKGAKKQPPPRHRTP